jgi:hypothetical protein
MCFSGFSRAERKPEIRGCDAVRNAISRWHRMRVFPKKYKQQKGTSYGSLAGMNSSMLRIAVWH